MLRNQFGKQVTLYDINDKNILLLFFPFAFSSVCTNEMCTMRDDISSFENLNAKVFGISVDSHYTLKEWAKSLQIKFDLLSDFNKEVSQKYDSFDEYFIPAKYNYKGVSKRSAIIIGKDKTIKYFKICSDPDEQPNYNEIKNVLMELH